MEERMDVTNSEKGFLFSYSEGIGIRSSGFERIPQVTKELIAEQVDEVEKLLEKIEEDDEVQKVFHSIQE